MDWRQHIKRLIPPTVLNEALLCLPYLYGVDLIRYETNLRKSEIAELLSQLKEVMHLGGDIVECGSSRCGTSAIMARFLRSHRVRKTIYALDTYEGFNLTELAAERQLGLTTSPDHAFTSTSFEYVTRKIRRLGVGEIVVPVKGFFQDTMPQLQTPCCFAFIDCDLKDSVLYCADTIWPRLTNGGRIVFDDYTSRDFRGARLGIEEFVRRHEDKFSEHGLLDHLYYVEK